MIPEEKRSWSLFLGRLVAIIAMLNMAGWLLDYRPLQELLPGEPSMTILTATTLLVSGVLLLRLSCCSAPSEALQLEVFVGAIYQCTLIATALLLNRIGTASPQVSHGVDTWLERSGVPSLLAAANVALISIAMVLMVERICRPLASLCLGASLLICFGALLGRALNLPWLMGDWESLSPSLPLETTVLFLLLAVGCGSIIRQRGEWRR